YLDRILDVLAFRALRALARLERVVAVFDPLDLDRGRQRVAGDLVRAAEVVASALQDERRRAQIGEGSREQLLRLPGRMERVAHADEPAHRSIQMGAVGD